MKEPVPVAGDARRGSSRAVADAIPAQAQARHELMEFVHQYAQKVRLVPPLSLAELGEHCQRVLAESSSPAAWRKYVAVLINNEVWRGALAAAPFHKRLLLLPRCLRPADQCPAASDEWGLSCQECGRCVIGLLKARALSLGYVVLVAEGVPVVVSLVESGKIEALVGVSCLDSLERIFPCMEAAAVPGIAIPLLQDGCHDTQLDFDWAWETLGLSGPSGRGRSPMEGMRTMVESWFTPASLESILGPPANRTEQIAHEWLSRSGKRWRPFLAACSYAALDGDALKVPPEGLRKIAMAVECFHKASLIHDDIEDNDALRYGQKTLHEQYGTAIALNVGDFLIGEGYRMIGEAPAEPSRKEQMLLAAASGHRRLCLGQGQELLWMREQSPLAVEAVLDIFRHKTAPAFEVALRLGAIYAGAGPETHDVLAGFSDTLGVAYQIRDDLEDFGGQGDGDDVRAMRPSLVLALGYQKAAGADKLALEDAWRRRELDEKQLGQLRRLLEDLGAPQEARRMLYEQKELAMQSLRSLGSAALKGMLRRVVGKIFGDLDLARRLA